MAYDKNNNKIFMKVQFHLCDIATTLKNCERFSENEKATQND